MNVAKKGRIQCPNCSKDVTFVIIENSEDIIVTCPHCQHQFNIHPSSKKNEKRQSSRNEECSWEEHGEPRKTILSSIKPRTDKPMIATFLLLIVVCMGIIASITPSLFFYTPIEVLSTFGFQGSISVDSTEMDMSIVQANLTVDENNRFFSKSTENNSLFFNKIPLGRNNADLIFINDNQSYAVNFDFYVLPFFVNSYTLISDTDTSGNKILIEHDGYGWCSSIILLLTVVCLIGLLSSWKRNYSDVALIGCLVGIFTIGFFFIGSLLSIIAFYLIYTSRDEFDDGKKGKSF